MTTNWTRTSDLRLQVQRLWDRGELLRHLMSENLPALEQEAGDNALEFPLRLRLKKPTSAQMGEHFDPVRDWIKAIATIRYTRLEQQETRHPQLGRNVVPHSLWIETLNDALAFIGKRGESDTYLTLLQKTLSHNELLLSWIKKRPLKVLELAADWDRLLRVHKAIVQRPTHNTIYLRQLSVPGVDTKFIERHRSTLTEWLDITLPAERINERHTGSRGFAQRFGFRDKAIRLRIRSLDRSMPLLQRDAAHSAHTADSTASADMTLDAEFIQQLDTAHSRVLITENEINYLTLPELSGTLALFGSGYGLQALGTIEWLHQCDIWYWGDLDTHGFAILHELRTVLPEARSLMMDRETLLAHESLWGNEAKPADRALPNLTEQEADLYQAIVEHRYGNCLRLEQEQINYQYMMRKLKALC